MLRRKSDRYLIASLAILNHHKHRRYQPQPPNQSASFSRVAADYKPSPLFSTTATFFALSGAEPFNPLLQKVQFLLPSATMPTTTAETLSLVTRNVSVAPLVLLSAVDHYNRTVQNKTKRRVVGVLLGQNDGKNVRVSNSFAGTS